MEESRYFLSISRSMRRHFFQKLLYMFLYPIVKNAILTITTIKLEKKEYFHGISDRN